MKKAQVLAAIFLSVISQTSLAALESSSIPEPIVTQTPTALALTNGLYKFTQDAQLTPAAVFHGSEIEDNTTGVDLTFSKDEPVAVELYADDQVLVTLLPADDETETVPAKVLLSRADFALTSPEFLRAGTEAQLKSEYSSYVDTQTAGMGWSGSRRRGHHAIGNCVHYVLNHLGVHVRGNGKDITRALHGVGFHSSSCSEPAVGTVASWTGGWHGLGHTGIWNGRCFAYDRGCGSPGHMYHLIGCVHR